MAEHRLRHSFPAEDNNGLLTYGGSQMLSDSAAIRQCGCGAVAAADLFIYLHRYRRGCNAELFSSLGINRPIPVNSYNDILKKLCRRFFPITPPFGINGVGLVCGINFFFRQNGYDLRAQWGVRYSSLWSCIEEMLDRDIPVIIAVGPNLPKFWQNNQTGLYTRLPDGSYRRIGAVKAHYMSVTAISDDWITVSSWGHRYYISRRDYELYVRAYSSRLVCNIVYIKPV